MLSNVASLGVVIVAYRSSRTIMECVRSALADPNVREVVVIDNSSDQHTGELLRLVGSRVTYFESENVGFSAGCNRGMRELSRECEYVAFVNPDLKLLDPLTPLMRFLQTHTRALVAGESSITEASSARRSVTVGRELAKAVFGSRVYSLPARGGSPRKVEQLSGALLVGRLDYIREIGGFDELFELYYEDVDICQRVNADGDGCWLFPGVTALHSGGESSSRVPTAAYTASRVSRVRYLRKHYPSRMLSVKVLGIAILELLARSVSSPGESWSARTGAVRAQIRELRRPGSVQALDH